MASSTHPEVELISRNNFAFSNSLHEQLRITGEGENLVFSPFSFGLVLLMARFGARGATAEQLDRVLNPTNNVAKKLEDLRSMRRGFFRVLKSIEDDRSSDYNVSLANRMFTGTGFNVSEEFKKISKATLHIKVKQLNFTDDQGRPAAEAINSWVANKMNGKINGIISSDSLTSQTQVILVNTINFKSPWKMPFEPKQTRNATFHVNMYKETQVAMMTSEGAYAYGELEGMNAQAVILPYKGNRFSMHVYVPKSRIGLNLFLRTLKTKSMEQIRKNIHKPRDCGKVRLSLPKFKIQSELKLMQPLKQMGARDMFSMNRADFTGISDDANLYVSHVLQKAVITVDEGTDTEATAAPGTRAGLTCTPTVTNVIADRPFYFQIVDEQTGAVLIAGAVRDPSTAVVEVDSVTALDAIGVRIMKPAATPQVPAPRSPSTTPAVHVEATTTDLLPQIVCATAEQEIKTYSEITEDLRTIVLSKDRLTGVTWDGYNRLLYYSGPSAINEVKVDGTGIRRVATIFTQHGTITGLDFDYITSNLYVATDNGYVLACNSSLYGLPGCFVVLEDQRGIKGIALNPNQGTMYLTKFSFQTRQGSILRASMDGTSLVVIAERLGNPSGLAIDHISSRLVWADYPRNHVMTSDLRGGDVQKIGEQSKPRGVAVYNDYVYWGDSAAKKLLRGTTSGGNIQSIDLGSSIEHLTVATDTYPNITRSNHCEGQRCAGICVLTETSFRCLV